MGIYDTITRPLDPGRSDKKITYEKSMDRERSVYQYLSSIADATGYDRLDLMKAAHIESSFGADMGDQNNDKYGLMQSGHDTAGKYGVDRYDMANFYGAEVRARTKSKNSDKDLWYQANTVEEANNMGIEKGLLEYMTWQQGRNGMAKVINIATDKDRDGVSFSSGSLSGNLGSTREHLINNMALRDKKHAKELRKLSDHELANQWIALTKEKWETAGSEIEFKDDYYEVPE